MYGEGNTTNQPQTQTQQANNNLSGAQQHASSLNSGYPGTQSRAQQMDNGYDPNSTAGCSQNMKTFAIVSTAFIVIGFILAFLVDNDGDTFTFGLLLIVIGCIMVMCLLCNAFGCVPCFFCCLGPPIWIPAGGMWYSRRGYGGGPARGPGPPGGQGGGGGGYPGGGPH